MYARIAYDAFSRNEILFPSQIWKRELIDYLQYVPELPAQIDIDAEAVLHEIIAQHGIFTEQAQRLFSFAHLTFQEYFAAKHIVDNAVSGTLETLAAHATDDKWREVFLLTSSLLSDATNFLTRFEKGAERFACAPPTFNSVAALD